MKSATLLILASAVFMVIAMLHKKGAPSKLSGTGSLSPSWPQFSAPAPKQVPTTPVKLIAAQPPSRPVAAVQTDFVSSALSVLKRGVSVAETAPAAPLRKTHSRSELRIARGLVREELPNGVVLGWVVRSATNSGVYAGDGRGMNAIYANLVVTHERLQFGRLMTVDRGALRESVYPPEMWVPETYVYGTAFLEGYPAASPGRSKGLKVVAAPSGSIDWQGNSIPSYTATFTLND